MAVADLDLSPRLTGRASAPVSVEVIRELTEADIALLASERGIKPASVTQLRDRHHALARCLAQGMKPAEASAVTGYSLSRISILKGDATFQELVEHYTKVEQSLFADFTERATNLSLTAMNALNERLEDEPEKFSVGELVEVAKFAADRTGHAPVSKQINLNASVDLGNRLAAARQRLAAIENTSREATVAPLEGERIIEATATLLEERVSSSG